MRKIPNGWTFFGLGVEGERRDPRAGEAGAVGAPDADERGAASDDRGGDVDGHGSSFVQARGMQGGGDGESVRGHGVCVAGCSGALRERGG